MAYVDGNEAGRDHLWFLDSGCSNHMCGKRELFSQFENNFREKVKLGNDMSLTVQGTGNIRMEINGIVQVITEVFFAPELKNNLLSIDQLQEKGLAVLMQHRKCKIYHPEKSHKENILADLEWEEDEDAGTNESLGEETDANITLEHELENIGYVPSDLLEKGESSSDGSPFHGG
ncbi:uncharacterized protein LOC114266634 [Camellia sinensis]|uniref:uncharacterized protein LOC114266634 n=1 Tax=Camellia sinensis TaxID=4442 RepID=UPI0010358A7B|nr:uncharacterized protein LOC114266634 [Camellia sinensis]